MFNFIFWPFFMGIYDCNYFEKSIKSMFRIGNHLKPIIVYRLKIKNKVHNKHNHLKNQIV